jgi:hypothetical protein
MAQHDFSRHGFDDGLGPPIERFNATRFVRKETVLKQEIESYYSSDIDNVSIIRYGKRRCTVSQSLDLPDAVCDGLTYKQRLIQTERGDCLLLVRWKPERHMRRNAPEWSQKWFVEKQLFPPDNEKLFARLEKRFQDQAEAAAAPALPAAAAEAEEGHAAEPAAAGEDDGEEE